MQKKKLLGSALALAMLIPYGPAQAADLMKNLKVDGGIDLQATSANNVTDFNTGKYDHLGDAQVRVMVNAGWDLLDDVHSMVTLRDNSNFWGAGPSAVAPAGPGSASQNLNGGAGNTGLLNDIYLDQAYFKVDKVFGAVDTTLGRQFYGNAGDLVIYFGPYSNIYGLSVSAIDAARFDWSNDMFGVTGLAGKFKGTAVGTFEGAPGAGSTTTGDIDVQGLNLTAKGNDMWNGAAYIWEKETHNTPNGAIQGTSGVPGPQGYANDYLWVAGLKGKVAAGPAWLKAEFDKNFGSNRNLAAGTGGLAGNTLPGTSANYDGWALKIDLGAKADVGVATLNPWAQFADASGGLNNNKNYGFQGINSDYRPGGIYGYFSSLGGTTLTGGIPSISNGNVGNRVIWGLGLNGTPAAISKLTAGVSYWDYHYQSALGEAQEIGSAAAVGNKHIGSELDVNLSWKHSDNVAFNVGWGQFWTGGAINNFNGAAHTGTSPVTLFSAGTSVKF